MIERKLKNNEIKSPNYVLVGCVMVNTELKMFNKIVLLLNFYKELLFLSQWLQDIRKYYTLVSWRYLVERTMNIKTPLCVSRKSKILGDKQQEFVKLD